MAVDAIYERTFHGFKPASEQAEAFWKAAKVGDLVRLVGTKPRNLKFHRYYWVMLGLIGDNLPNKIAADDLHYMCKMATGVVREIVMPTGQIVRVPAETNFNAMDEVAFRKYVRAAATAMVERLLPGSVPDELLAEVERMAGW
jgi:hypothetical protein